MTRAQELLDGVPKQLIYNLYLCFRAPLFTVILVLSHEVSFSVRCTASMNIHTCMLCHPLHYALNVMLVQYFNGA